MDLKSVLWDTVEPTVFLIHENEAGAISGRNLHECDLEPPSPFEPGKQSFSLLYRLSFCKILFQKKFMMLEKQPPGVILVRKAVRPREVRPQCPGVQVTN